MKLLRLTIGQFKETDPLELIGDDKPRIVLPKGMRVEVKESAEDGDGVLTFTASDETVDRENDVLAADGWKLDPFSKNGPFLWAHEHRLPPIGKSLATWVEGGRLRSRIEFTGPEFKHPYGDGFGWSMYQMYRQGFLNAVSVGFIPLKWKVNEDRSKDGPVGFDFIEQELLEESAVPVPANPNALVEASKSLDVRPIYDWTERVLDEGVTLFVPREAIEAARRSLAPVMRTMTVVKGTITWGSAHSGGTPVAPRDAEWDGPGETAAAEVDDLKVMATWVDGEAADTKGAYKLPHHKAAGQHAVVWRGVTAAMGALLGARGGVDVPDGDRKGIYNHLARHYRDDFDEEPPEFRAYDAEEVARLFPLTEEEQEAYARAVVAAYVDTVVSALKGIVDAEVSLTDEQRAALDGAITSLATRSDGGKGSEGEREEGGSDDDASSDDEIEFDPEDLRTALETVRDEVNAGIDDATKRLNAGDSAEHTEA